MHGAVQAPLRVNSRSEANHLAGAARAERTCGHGNDQPTHRETSARGNRAAGPGGRDPRPAVRPRPRALIDQRGTPEGSRAASSPDRAARGGAEVKPMDEMKPVLRTDMLYLGDNGRCFCGQL